MKPQELSVKRASVEFHNFASLGEPERALKFYAEENIRRGAIIRKNLPFIGQITPFLEIGANVGHTSYLLANEFGADGFALDISADALRHGVALQEQWDLRRGLVRVAGDAANLPFRDNSLRFVMAHQMLSQFMNIESIFIEVKRVLAPGGIFLFSEEPLRRRLTLGLYRCGYYENMKPWERKLYDWGLLGFVVRDVIGANQEESFGIHQNHSMGLSDWHRLVQKHFTDHRYDIFVAERGWGERVLKKALVAVNPHRSVWTAAKQLGGTLAAACKKEGEASTERASFDHYEQYLRCPDCKSDMRRSSADTLYCTNCSYSAPNEGLVYNLLPSAERKELYPGDRPDVIDFSLPSHSERLLDGWYDLEGVYGNKYRWIGERATARLVRVASGPQRVRVRGHLNEGSFRGGKIPTVALRANGVSLGEWKFERTGLFIVEADLPDASDYTIEILASPLWQVPSDERRFTVNISMLRLVPKE